MGIDLVSVAARLREGADHPAGADHRVGAPLHAGRGARAVGAAVALQHGRGGLQLDLAVQQRLAIDALNLAHRQDHRQQRGVVGRPQTLERDQRRRGVGARVLALGEQL